MLFKLLKSVWIVSLVALPLKAEETASAYRGEVRGLESEAVRYADIRSDSRYLFYSSGAASWNVIDLLDGVRKGSAQTVKAAVKGLFLRNDSLLVVVTSDGIQHFDVEDVFEPELLSYEFDRPTDDGTEVFKSCQDKNGRVYFLETDNADQRHVLRYLNFQSQNDGEFSWSNLFSGSVPDSRDLLPVSILCGANRVHIIAAYFETDPEERHIASLTQTSPPSISTAKISSTDYIFDDVILSADGANLLHRQSRLFDDNEIGDDGSVLNPSASDSRLLASPESAPASPTIANIGSGGVSLASFFKGSQVFYAAFVEQDILESSSNPPLNQFLSILRSSFSNNPNFGTNRYTGLATAGTQAPSTWLSTAADHYAYGLVETQGVIRVSDAPSLNFVTDPGTGTLSGNSNLNFQIQSPTKLSYEIRIDESFDEKGESAGISTGIGKKIAEGILQAGQAKSISLTLEDVNISRNAQHSLLIFGQRSNNQVYNEVARLGLLFNFDPPPSAVKAFRLSYGDSSIRAHWYSDDRSQDLSHYLVYFSYDPAALVGELPVSSQQLEASFRSTVAGIGGASFSSPILVEAAGFEGSVDIAPIENDRDLYVRVQAVDESGQYSRDNPEQLSERPRRTRSLATALGGSNSCQITGSAFSSGWLWALLVLLGMCFGQKKWAQRLRNRRGGD
jgi:hypothetical protein